MSLCFHTVLKERGLVRQTSDKPELKHLLQGKGSYFYIGFDATGESLHVGHIMLLMILRWGLKYGHKPIILIGGATSQIGDPSGKSKTRKLLEKESILRNVAGISQCIKRVLSPWSPDKDYHIVNNSTWIEELKCLDFFRSIGKHYTINRMIAENHTVRVRLKHDSPMSFLEFTYGLFQAYDFLHLYREYGCRIQIGGSDQWCNMLAGVELIRREEHADAYVISCPLLETADGKKMGKTEQGAIWLDPKMTSIRDFWHFWRNIKDEDVEKCLKFFTKKPLDEIKSLIKDDINGAKIALASEMTKSIHGETIAKEFEAQAQEENTQEIIRYIFIWKTDKEKGLLDAMRESGFAHSNNHARKLIREGIVHVDEDRAKEEGRILMENKKGMRLVTIGGRKRIKIRWPKGIESLAKNGDSHCQFQLGWMYAQGQPHSDHKQDDAKACYWYKKAAHQGLAGAQNNLGWMYHQGLGVPQDYATAREWYEKAAHQGYALAQHILEILKKEHPEVFE